MRKSTTYETGIYRASDDYRVPDLVFTLPSARTHRGVDGAAELVMEILSPGDESYVKLDWYADLGVREMLVVNPATMAVELYRGTSDGPVRQRPDANGMVWSEVLQASFVTVGRSIRITWEGGEAGVTTG